MPRGLFWMLLVGLLLGPACSKDECLPACAGKECGSDGCGGQCGACDTPPPGVCYTGEGECVLGACVYFTEPHGTPCADNVYCDGVETCQAGECLEGEPIECGPPDNPCMEAVCDEASQGCIDRQLSDGSACEDGDPCTEEDTCQAGVCVPGPNGCPDNVVILMYLAADNDLDEWMVDNWEAMESAQVDDFSWLRVFVLMDHASFAEWSDTRFYEVHNGYSQELDGPSLGLTVGGSEELNMGDGATVTAFIQDVRDITGPNARFFLLMLDHGDGWWKGAETDPSVRGCCYDDTDGYDWLAQLELSLAIRDEGIDLLGFDACVQGMAEVAYEHRGDAFVMIGSQELEGGWGWDYATLLSDFGQGGDPSEEAFAQLAVDSYVDLSLFNDDETATLAAYDLLEMDDLAAAAVPMAAALTDLSTNDFNDLCDQLDWYSCEGTDCWEYADLVQLAEAAKQIDPAHGAVYDAVVAAVSEVVIYERHGNLHPDAHGLCVFYACDYYPDVEYSDNTWAKDTGWGEMVNAH